MRRWYDFIILGFFTVFIIFVIFSILITFNTDSKDDWSYSVIIDAGSTGSRLFLYHFHSMSDQELLDIQPVVDFVNRPVVKKVSPGLSSFADRPENAAEYIKPLLDYATEFIPEAKRPYTPVFILATAGMRLIPVHQQDAILSNLRQKLPAMSQLQIIDEHINIIDGTWEGIFSWIAINYILGRFSRNESDRKQTVGMVDMGGASMQIAVEVGWNTTLPTSSSEIINLGCHDEDDRFKYQLFSKTFLGYGANEGIHKYEQFLSEKISTEKSSISIYARDPCLPVNLMKTVRRKNGSFFIRKGIGDWKNCEISLVNMLNGTKHMDECDTHECYLGMVRAPDVHLSAMELFGFSEYWFTSEDVLSLGGRYNYENFSLRSRKFCSQKWSIIKTNWLKKLYPKADEDRIKTQCFKSAWLAAILHSGFHLNKTQNNFRSIKEIDGQEVQWTLGAMLYNMRYFPLREVQRKKLMEKKRQDNFSWIYYMLSVLFVINILVYWLTRKQKTLRRERSFWGYMMVSPEENYFP